MDANVVIQAVATLGFPIVMCGGLFWYMVTEGRENRKIIEANTIAITELTGLVREMKEEVEDHACCN